MKRSILIYGTIAGLITIVTMIIGIEMGNASVWIGFLIMFIAFSSIFVAIKQHRDETLGGVIKFGTAFFMGLAISAVASLAYVLIWEIYLAATDFKFIEKYASSILEAGTAEAATEAERLQATADAEQFKIQYMNPLLRLPMTFMEIFPVGLLVSLVSAAVLRYRGGNG